jgi:tetratricopeptide (TPR) repeat protein
LCGSGKKFKWCCGPFYEEIEKAYKQENNRQHEAALGILQRLTQEHPKNAAARCYYAEMLLKQDKVAEAEKVLEEALALDPHQPRALYLRGAIRQANHDLEKALADYRLAADACDPAATGVMADIQLGIGQCELLQNRPVAAKAALDIAHRCEPSNQEIQDRLNRFFGVESNYPTIVRKNYGFKKMIKRDALPADVWQATQGGKLGKLHQLMEKLVQQLSYDPAFFYNLGLTRAWVGDNQGALEALDQFVRQATDEKEAAEAWALAEALRLGVEGESTQNLHFAVYRLVDFRRFVEILGNDKRIIDVEQSQSVINSKRLDRPLPTANEQLATFDLPRVQAHLLIMQGEVWVYTFDAGQLESARKELEELWGNTVEYQRSFTKPASFHHLLEQVFHFRLPEGLATEHATRLSTEMFRSFFEDQWAHRPASSLQGNTPIDASAHPVLRRKVLGQILLWEDILALPKVPITYSMNDLRRKLGLFDTAPASSPAPATTNVTLMSAAELSALDPPNMKNEDLQQAFTAAKRLDANELATKFAQALVQRTEQQDFFTYDQHIIFQLLGEDRLERAYATTLKAMDRDAKQNAGKRSIDYRKLRLKVLLAGKRLAEAKIDIEKLLAEKVEDLNLFVYVVEELLKFGHKDLAAKYAKQGRQVAKKKNDADSAGFFEEIETRYGAMAAK